MDALGDDGARGVGEGVAGARLRARRHAARLVHHAAAVQNKLFLLTRQWNFERQSGKEGKLYSRSRGIHQAPLVECTVSSGVRELRPPSELRGNVSKTYIQKLEAVDPTGQLRRAARRAAGGRGGIYL